MHKSGLDDDKWLHGFGLSSFVHASPMLSNSALNSSLNNSNNNNNQQQQHLQQQHHQPKRSYYHIYNEKRGAGDRPFQQRLPTIDERTACSSQTLLSMDRPLRGIRFPRTESLTSQKFMESLKNINSANTNTTTNGTSSSLSNSNSSSNLSVSTGIQHEQKEDEIKGKDENDIVPKKKIARKSSGLSIESISSASTTSLFSDNSSTKSLLAEPSPQSFTSSSAAQRISNQLFPDMINQKGIFEKDLFITNNHDTINSNNGNNGSTNTNDNIHNSPHGIDDTKDGAKVKKHDTPTSSSNKKRPSKFEIDERLRRLDASFPTPSITAERILKKKESTDSLLSTSSTSNISGITLKPPPMLASSSSSSTITEVPLIPGLIPSNIFDKSFALQRRQSSSGSLISLKSHHM